MFPTDRRLLWILTGSMLAAVIGAASGLATATFLTALHVITNIRIQHPWLLYGLPFAGIAIAWAYAGFGKSGAGGNNLLLDQINATDGVNRVQFRILPLILVATLLTHLFGGSVGREGTAVQMGGVLAGWISRLARLSTSHLRLMLMCGIASGFSSVFGTPLAGTIFGMEVVSLGGMRYDALIPCLISAVVGDLVVRMLHVDLGDYVVASGFPELSLHTAATVTIAGIAFGLAGLLFAETTAAIENWSERLVGNPLLRTFLGGIAVILATVALGTRSYNGLSLPLLNGSFTGEDIPLFAFLAKLLLTSLTLGVGFKGGEVTPLFVIGATLGVTLSRFLDMPADTLAALGLVAVFAAAANTPIACVVMGIELFGGGQSSMILFGIAIFVAYTISGHRGIYDAQRILSSKYFYPASPFIGASLLEARRRRAPLSLRATRLRQTFPRRRRPISDRAPRDGGVA